MERKLILSGPGASGKDYFAKYLIENGYHKSIDYTTRPKRGEDDIDYTFVEDLPLEDCYAVFNVKSFNGMKDFSYRYGYSIKETIVKDFSIRPPSVIKDTIDLLEMYNKEYLLIYFDIPESVRENRLLKRSGGDSVERRLRADREDFKDFVKVSNPDIIVNDPMFDTELLFNRSVLLK